MCIVLSHEFGVVRLYRTFSIYIVAGETRCAGCSCTSSGWFKHIEPRGTISNHMIKEIARCVEFCHMSSDGFDCTEPSLSTSLHGQQGMQGVVHLFGVVQAHRTSSNLLEPYHYKDSKVCRVLSHQFGVVRLYRTFSIYIVAGETRCAGCLCTCSGWFKHIEPRRTFPNHIITEIAKCVEFCHMSSWWFDHTEPSLSGVQGAYALVQGCFKHIEPHRIFPNHIITEIAKCVEFCHMSSGWFDHTEPSLSTSLQGKQGVQGAYALVRGGSSTSNLLEPSRTTSLQR